MSEAYGKFQLIKKLATGGMAQIYLARQSGADGRLCVVKRILPHLAENHDFVRMFLDEAKIAARLHHPNIVQVHELGEQDGSFFLAMEYIHGEDLRRIWKRSERAGRELPIEFVVRVIADACAGLDYAHKKSENGRPLNIVHRDISPQNVLVAFDGSVKVVDFGIAKAADKMTETRSGVLKGKYSYMSPEQAAGRRDVDARTDIFALGVVLYELLTGTRLFKRGSDVATLHAVTECQFSPPSGVNTRVPRELDLVVMKALARSPDDRYAQAAELQRALEDWLSQHPVPADHVATSMKALYGDRLRAEAQEGQPLPESAEIRSGEDEVGSRRPGSTSRSRSLVPPGPRSAENTAAMRPSRPGSPVPRAPELPAETRPFHTGVNPVVAGGRGRRLALTAALALLLGGAAAAVWTLRSGTATVAPGTVTTVDAVPGTRELAPPVEPEPPPALVRLSLKSDPEGARFFVGDRELGSAPAPLELRSGEEFRIRAELEGFDPLERTVRVGEGPEQPELFTLQHRAPDRPARFERAAHVVAEPEEPRATGTVRIVIKPIGTYANVKCGSHLLGQLPNGEGDPRLPAGSYDCTFTHPDYGSQSKRVEVRPNGSSKVIVTFNQD